MRLANHMLEMQPRDGLRKQKPHTNRQLAFFVKFTNLHLDLTIYAKIGKFLYNQIAYFMAIPSNSKRLRGLT
jgi:hypothetical protein